MNGDILGEWIENTVMPSLDRHYCLVVDTASYHNALLQEINVSTSSSSKNTIKLWVMKKHTVQWNAYATWPAFPGFKLAQIHRYFILTIMEHWHERLKLPSFHSNINPMELAWTKVKGYVADGNNKSKLYDVKQLAYKGISKINQGYFALCGDYVSREERI